MSYRKEKKYKFNITQLNLLKYELIQDGMKVLYPRRIINSFYFDTKNLLMFHHSEQGILPRKKIRIRWYEKNLEFKKEIKISSIEGRFKKSYFIGSLNKKKLNQYKIFDKDYGFVFPYLFVKYSREYYIYRKLRFTFDSNIEYQIINSNNTSKSIDKHCVMEIKASNNINNDYLDKIISYQNERFSKYCRGVNSFLC